MSSGSDDKIGFFIPLAQILYITGRARQQDQNLRNQINNLNNNIESVFIALLRGWIYSHRPGNLGEYGECLTRGASSSGDSSLTKISNTGNTCHRVAGALLMIKKNNFNTFLNTLREVIGLQSPSQQQWDLVPVVVDILSDYQYKSAFTAKEFVDIVTSTSDVNVLEDLLRRLERGIEGGIGDSIKTIKINIRDIQGKIREAGLEKVAQTLSNIAGRDNLIENCLPEPQRQRQGSQS